MCLISVVVLSDEIIKDATFNKRSADHATFCVCSIVRPVKRDWAVLSKGTPEDISI